MAARNSILTVPNGLSFLRALGIPLFIYFALVTKSDGWAIFVLMIGGATDYFDGKLARILNQESALGALLDPAVDRLYIFATLIVLAVRDALPIWVIALLISRDLVLAILTIALKAKGLGTLPVTYLGKAATFNLLYAFPLLLLALADSTAGTIAFILGWSFAIWGIALYLSTGVTYFRSGILAIRAKTIKVIS